MRIVRTARWVLAAGLVIAAAWLALRSERDVEQASAPSPAPNEQDVAAEVTRPEIATERALVSEAPTTPVVPPAAPEAIAAESDGFVLEVIVHGEAGAPLPGATVSSDRYPYVVATTDEAGHCALRFVPETRVLDLRRVE